MMIDNFSLGNLYLTFIGVYMFGLHKTPVTFYC